MTASWTDVLDSLTCQVDLQDGALRCGHGAPPDLEIHPPDVAMTNVERLRAIELFERCEALLDHATERAVSARSLRRSPYGRAR